MLRMSGFSGSCGQGLWRDMPPPCFSELSEGSIRGVSMIEDMQPMLRMSAISTSAQMQGVAGRGISIRARTSPVWYVKRRRNSPVSALYTPTTPLVAPTNSSDPLASRERTAAGATVEPANRMNI